MQKRSLCASLGLAWARASLCSLSRLSSGSRAVAPISMKTINSDQLSKAEGVNTCNSLTNVPSQINVVKIMSRTTLVLWRFE